MDKRTSKIDLSFFNFKFLVRFLQKWRVPLVWKLSLISLGNLIGISILIVVGIIAITNVKQKINTIQQIGETRLTLSQLGDNLNFVSHDVILALSLKSLKPLNNYNGIVNNVETELKVYNNLSQEIDSRLFAWSNNLTQLLDQYKQLILEMNDGSMDKAYNDFQENTDSLSVQVREDFDNESAQLDIISQDANNESDKTANQAGSILIDGLTILIVFNVLFALLQNLAISTPMSQTRRKLEKLNFNQLPAHEISKMLYVPNQDEVGLLVSTLSQTLTAVQTQKDLIYQRTEQLIERLNTDIYQLQTYREAVITAQHDLKSPLGRIQNNAELLLMTELNLNETTEATLNRIIEITNSAVRSLSAVLNKALSNYNTQLNLTEVSMYELVMRVLHLVNTHNLKVDTKVDSTPVWLDSTIFEHLLLNLVNNASHFANSQILIKGSTIAYEGQPFYELSIWNDGPTIPKEAMESIFQAGMQTSLGKQKGGNGLGLYIVKTIVERHNGLIEVDNINFLDGRSGVSFTVRLPQIQD